MENYESLIKSQVADVLRKYFICDDNYNHNEAYDENFSAEDAIDAIHKIIGSI